MENIILSILLLVVVFLFFPVPPFGILLFLLWDWFVKKKELRLSMEAPLFPCVKVLKTEDGFVVCKSYYPPIGVGISNMYRPGHIKNIRVLNTEPLVPGEIIHVTPFSFNKDHSSISLKTTKEKISMSEYRRRVASFLSKASY